MKSLNRVFLMGHLGFTPELHTGKSGRPYTRLRLATGRYKANEGGGFAESTDWHSVFVWGEEAKRCAEYLSIGAMVFVEGSLSYWQVATDVDTPKAESGYKNAIHADNIRFITYGRGAGATVENIIDVENLDNHQPPRNHNAVAHPVM